MVLINCLGSAAVLPMLSAATMSRLDALGEKDQVRAPHSCLPARSGANKKSFPRGAPMQHLAPRRNLEG